MRTTALAAAVVLSLACVGAYAPPVRGTAPSSPAAVGGAAHPDFDGDGHADLVVGAPHASGGRKSVGEVHVIHGSPDGLDLGRRQVWGQNSKGLRDKAESGDQFGWSVGTGDFDGDGFADLAVGVPYEDRLLDRVGIVHVLHGSRKGLQAKGSQSWHQDAPGIADVAEERDQFGQSLAAADFDGDGFGDLAIGVWFEDYRNRLSNEGGLHVIYGSRDGLRSEGSEFWHQDRRGTLDRAHISDRFGQVLTAADFDGDGHDDLAVGIPSTDLGGGVHENRGAVHVFPGSPQGLDAEGDRYFSQRTNGALDRPEKNDHFGEALAAADFDGDGFADLAVGIPYEDLVSRDDGAVYVVHGTRRGLALSRDLLVELSRRGLSERPMRGAHFGWAMAGQHSHSGVPRTADPDV